MEIRISRILSEYYDYTRKESEEYIRQGRVKRNGEIITIGDKAEINDVIELDDVRIPLKGIFKRVEREQVDKETGKKFKSLKDDHEYADYQSPKNKNLRKGRKSDLSSFKRGKNYK